MNFHLKVSSFRKKGKFPSILFNPNWVYSYFFSHSEKMKEQEKMCLMSVPSNKFFIFFKTWQGNNFGNGLYTTLPYPGWKYHMHFSTGSDSMVLLAEVWWKNLIYGLVFTTRPIRAQIKDFITQENWTRIFFY